MTAGDLAIERPGLADGELIVGIPPEALGPANGTGPSLDFHVAVVEPLGDELIVHGSAGADLAASAARGGDDATLLAGGADRNEVVVRLHPRERPAEGTTIRLGLEAADVHLFNAHNVLAIR